MAIGRTTRTGPASVPFRGSDFLHDEFQIAAYLEEMLRDGDARAVPLALRTVAEAAGGIAALAERSGLSRETLYRTLSDRGNPRLDTLAAILRAYGLRLAVVPVVTRRSKRSRAA